MGRGPRSVIRFRSDVIGLRLSMPAASGATGRIAASRLIQRGLGRVTGHNLLRRYAAWKRDGGTVAGPAAAPANRHRCAACGSARTSGPRRGRIRGSSRSRSTFPQMPPVVVEVECRVEDAIDVQVTEPTPRPGVIVREGREPRVCPVARPSSQGQGQSSQG